MALVLTIAGDRQAAEDVLQETYVQVWSNAAQYDPARGQPMAWLVTIARSRAIDRLRKERRAPRLGTEAELAEMPDPNPTSEDSAILSEATRRLDECLSELSNDQRKCIQMA